MRHPHSLTLAPLLASFVAAVALVACNRADDSRSAGQVLDQSVSKVEQKAKELGSEARVGTDKAVDAMADAGTKASAALRDAAISVEVKAKLAKDPDLRALRIDVDTAAGHVALRGTAPTAAARERAAELARTVTGVAAVDNELAVKTGS